LAEHAGATLLGAQDRQCAQQATQQPADKGQARAAQYLDGRNQAHIAFLIGARNRITVLATWLWAYLTFRRGSRLITGAGL
jgi:hypothetical protein